MSPLANKNTNGGGAIEVCRNVVHATSSGTVAAWWFDPAAVTSGDDVATAAVTASKLTKADGVCDDPEV